MRSCRDQASFSTCMRFLPLVTSGLWSRLGDALRLWCSFGARYLMGCHPIDSIIHTQVPHMSCTKQAYEPFMLRCCGINHRGSTNTPPASFIDAERRSFNVSAERHHKDARPCPSTSPLRGERLVSREADRSYLCLLHVSPAEQLQRSNEMG